MSTPVTDKLKVLLPHWAGHNQQHAAELRKWFEQVTNEDKETAALLERAAHLLEHATDCLQLAANRVGGETVTAHVHHHQHP
ncbi:MAG TPA: hypothetical protein VM578_08075 [Candidatus Saccharimonadales bacterium]|nr:hypothetical protein [Candidatus Saccharimonadales bacterium]